MGNGRVNNEGKPLEIARTLIGVRKGKYKGERIEFSVYYGNLALPLAEGRFVHLTPEKYSDLLHEFLFESEEGAQYAVPDEEKKRSDMQQALDREDELLKEMTKTEEAPSVESTPVSNGGIQPQEKCVPQKEAEPEPEPKDELAETKPLSRQGTVKNEPLFQQNSSESELLNRLKVRTAVQTVLIVFQLVCIVVLSILLIARS